MQLPESLMMSVSGIRGIVGEGMNPDIASRFTAAFARGLDGDLVVVGRDSRPSGPLLAEAVFATLRSMGCDPENPDVAALPDLAILFEVSAARWRTVASMHEGSAAIWLDLAARADRTAGLLVAGVT